MATHEQALLTTVIIITVYMHSCYTLQVRIKLIQVRNFLLTLDLNHEYLFKFS